MQEGLQTSSRAISASEKTLRREGGTQVAEQILGRRDEDHSAESSSNFRRQRRRLPTEQCDGAGGQSDQWDAAPDGLRPHTIIPLLHVTSSLAARGGRLGRQSSTNLCACLQLGGEFRMSLYWPFMNARLGASASLAADYIRGAIVRRG
jgi:hypothetical protein